MNLVRTTPNSMVIQAAYDRALIFDRMKKKAEADAQSESEGSKTASAPTTDTAEIKEGDEGTVYTYVPREKPKPNTVPFKTGFVFEYGNGTDKGPVTITVSDAEKIKVDMPKDGLTEERKRTIRSLVMLGLGKLDRDGFNTLLKEGRQTAPAVREELQLMGIKDSVPFGLGDSSFYFDGVEQLRNYRPFDMKA